MPVVQPRIYSRHLQALAHLRTDAPNAFDYLDDHERLTAHMTSSSPMMAGGSMAFTFDEARGRSVGSVIRMTGNVLGVALTVQEEITERAPPVRKAWETIGSPHLLVIGHYRMGFELAPAQDSCTLRVFIDYSLPTGFAWALGLIAARTYARWCVDAMARDAEKHSGIAATQKRL